MSDKLYVPPSSQADAFDDMDHDEALTVVECIFGFKGQVAERLLFQRWYRRYHTREHWKRDTDTLWYPKGQTKDGNTQ